MTMTTYTVDLGFEKFQFAADLVEASATIYTVDEDGDRVATQYQTADARHTLRGALRCALESCGSDYYADSSDDRSAYEQLDALVAGADIEVVS